MNRRAWLLMALLAALWGASYLFIKIALDDGMPPVFIVFVRILLGAVVLVPIAIYAGAPRRMRGLAGPVLFLAVVQVVGPFVLITYGERHIASSLTAILVSAAPIITALIAVRYDDEERPRGIAAAGVVMGIVGVVLLFGLDLSGDAAAIAGGLMVLLASAGYAVGSLYLKHRLQGAPPIGLAASTMSVK
jgi:drug/metabolite transporter (DMT)-like permease